MKNEQIKSIANKTKSRTKIKTATLPHRKREKNIKANKAASSGNKRLYPELRLKQKAANERMRQLEKAGIKSPAYQAVQAKLEVLGRQTKGDRGRRFSETGRATYNEKELLDKILSEFLDYETSTLKGAKAYQQEVWDAANKNQKLAEAGITRDEWLKFWENMPSKKDRLFGSSQYVTMIRSYAIKNGGLEDMDKMTIEEITAEIKSKTTVKEAYKAIGLTPKEFAAGRIKRAGK